MNKTALVMGYGRSGKAAEALLKGLGYEVEVWDKEDRNKEEVSERRDKSVASPVGASAMGARHSCLAVSVSAEGRNEQDSLRAAEPPRPQPDFAVVSPGIPLTHPWFADCRAQGIPVKSELQLGCEELKRRGWKLLAVTGSKGKSSVVKVVADAISRAGGNAVACGNYGVPVCEVALRAETGWAVVEVSSFMMETTTLPADFFEAAVILNLQEDHLDRHGSVEVYHGLKKKLLGFAKKGWVAEEEFSERRDRSVASPLGVVGDSERRDRSVASPMGASATGARHSCLAVSVSVEGRNAQDSLRAAEPPRPQSYFNNPILLANGEAAAALMRTAGLTEAQVAEGFATFVPLPHRMNLICERNGVRYVDDSKATSLAALEAGVIMAGTPVRLIAGGLPKGDDPKSVVSTLTKRVRKVYLIGQCAEVFAEAWKSTVDCEICGTMERAVESAVHDAEKGETVLLSPGTASFDQFKSYGERGDVFAELVKRQGKQE